MNRFHIILFLLPITLVSCKGSQQGISLIEAEQLNIDGSIAENDSIEAFIAPYRARIDQEMDSVLAYAPYSLSKTDGDLNTTIGNMMADAVMELSNPVFRSRTGKSIDLVLLNHGGIRSTVNKGSITTRTAYNIMPFENEVVVAELKGEQVFKMIDYLLEANTAHPLSGIELIINTDNSIGKALVQGKPIEKDKSYYVATNDYLYMGGDNMNFFSKAEGVTNIDYKIRNLLIDYFKKKDSIAPVIDNRFIRN